jgi:predicted negative regulator of RcsB-dependent stress response
MSAQSLFSKKNIESQKLDARTGIMEELNFPPEIISFVRKNLRTLQIILVVFLILVISWIVYDYYTERQENNAASLLASAMQIEKTAERLPVLEEVVNDYSRTDTALWGKLELANLDYQNGSYDWAILKYEEIISKLPSGSSLVPLVRLNLAQSYEETAQYEQAVAQYNLLKKATGFKEEAYLALGRIYKEKDDLPQARKEYEMLLSTMEDQADPQLRSKVQALLNSLGAGGNDITASKPEENKK